MGALVTFLTSLLVAAVPGAAHAAPGDPFDSSRPAVFVSQGTAGYEWTLYRFGLTDTGSFEVTREGPTRSRIWYNSLGFNPKDNYLYALTNSPADPTVSDYGNFTLIRIGQDHTITTVGNGNPGLGWKNAGAFTPDGDYWVGHDDSSVLRRINTTTGKAEDSLQLSGKLNTIDFTYKDGYFWGLGTGTAPYDPVITRIGLDGTISRWNLGNAIEGGEFGAAWTFGNGNLGFSMNKTGTVYQISVTNPSARNPVFKVVGTYVGPVTDNNDGANIPGYPADLGITKSGPETFTPAGQIEYTLTVTNEGPGYSSGWTVNDTVPTGLTNVVVTSQDAGCSIVGNKIQCAGGELEVGATATITVTATVASGVTGCLVNVAEVIGNEEDPVSGNNQDSTTACAEGSVSIEKSADPVSGTAVGKGQTVQYTLAFDYTGAVPADVNYTDNLRNVLDDATFVRIVDAGGLTVTGPDDGILRITGRVSADTAVVYEVVVKDEDRGDNLLRNLVVEGAEPAGDDDPCMPSMCTEHPVRYVDVSKSADPASGTTVGKGETVRYTVAFDHTGTGSAEVNYTDDLRGVLDDATFVRVVNDGGLTVTGPGTAGVMRITGTVSADTAVVYEVVVKDDDLGDFWLRNLVVEGSEPPGPDAPCVPGMCTEHPVRYLYVEKVGQGDVGRLDGAVFVLRADDGGKPGDVLGKPTLTKVEDGLFITGGIEPGVYWLEEQQAPEGFQLLATAVQFKIAEDGTVTLLDPGAHGSQVVVSTADDGMSTVTVTDQRAFDMPLAGGTGVLVFWICGGVLLAAAAGYLVVRRRTPGTSRHQTQEAGM